MSQSDLRKSLERQRKLVQAGYALHATLDLDELLGRILSVASDGVGADRGTVYLLSEDGETLWSRIVTGDETLEIRLPVGQGIAGAVAGSGETVRIEDAYQDPRFDPSWDEKSGFRTRQILCAPIRNRADEIVGVFQLLNKKEGRFDDEDEQFLAGLSIHAALAVENARLHASELEKERYDREVRLARGVQRALQPESRTFEAGGLAAAGLNLLCEDATGDYYDFLEGLPGGRFGVAIGDVSGHGLQAALVMAEARAFLRAFVRTTPELPAAIDLVNDHLVPDMAAGKFLTLFAAVLDPATGDVEWCNAGHNPPLVHRADGGAPLQLEATARVLGILPDTGCAAGAPVRLGPGDVLLLYTDGATEARDGNGEMFGEERLAGVLARAAPESPQAILAAIRGALHAWTGSGDHDDDLTLVAVKRGVGGKPTNL